LSIDIKLYGAGWRQASLIDVYGAVSSTLWLCGCNLRCPYCHNWRLAVDDRDVCKLIDVERLLNDLEVSAKYVDYLHITGGEPLTQYSELAKLLEIVGKEIGLKISLNTNLTLYMPLKKLIENNLVNHVATDLKIPFQMQTGLPQHVAEKLWSLYLESLKLVVDKGIPLELRVPVIRGLDYDKHVDQVNAVLEVLRNHRYIIIIQPLLNQPVTSPRDVEWCSVYCNPSGEDLVKAGLWFRKHAGVEVVIRYGLEMSGYG